MDNGLQTEERSIVVVKDEPDRSRRRCLEADEVLDFIDARLTESQVAMLQEHMDGCDTCRRCVMAMARSPQLDPLPLHTGIAGDNAGRAPAGTAPAEAGTEGSSRAPEGHHRSPRQWQRMAPSGLGIGVDDLLDYYQLLGPLGRGGLGMVYRGHDTLLDRPVAIKFLAITQAQDQERLRLLSEARAVARLRHPNVVTIHHVGEVDGEPYLVMELLEGETLRQLAKPLGEARVLEIALGLCRGLAAAHRQGLLHRDIKSSNVIWTRDGEVKLIDFGLAKLDAVPPARTTKGDSETRGRVSAEHPGLERPSTQYIEGDHGLLQPSLQLLPPTREGAIQGTPVYMAPEVYGGARATCQSDIYSVGVVLYELLTGYTPAEDLALHAGGDRTLETLNRPVAPPPLCQRLPEVSPALAAVVDRCLQRDPAERFASAEELLAALKQLLPQAHIAMPVRGNPYRGLRAFEAEHREVFFGRAQEIEEVVERLRGESLVLVTGDSGWGKSSLCRAGVLPRVVEGGLGGARRWSLVRLVPGRHALRSLAAALAPCWPSRANGRLGEEALWHRLSDAPEAAARELCGGQEAMRAEEAQDDGMGLLLFIDQLEELFTLGDEAVAVAIGRFLGVLGSSAVPSLRVLGAVRGDFLTRLAALPGIGMELPSALYWLRPLNAEGLRKAVVGPAGRMGVHFESDEMVRELVASALRNTGGLPLLAFTLAGLWEARDEGNRRIPAAALQEMGGVGGGLGRHGNGVLAGLRPAQRTAARRLLLQLVGAGGTRIRRTRRELGAEEDEAAGAALDGLVRGRLLAATEMETEEGGAIYEVAHEALIERWETLRGWLEEDRGQRVVRERIAAAAAEWERLGRADEALWDGRQLQEALAVEMEQLGPRERDFVVASRRLGQRRRWWRIGRGLGVILLPALSIGLMALRAERARAHEVRLHEARARSGLLQARSRLMELEQTRAGAMVLFDRQGDASLRVAAEKQWADERARAAQTDAILVTAEHELEAALELDPGQSLVRDLRGEILYERILLAEAWWNKAQVSELRGRLVFSDPERHWQKRLESPAGIVVEVMPAEAHLVLERYEVVQGEGPRQGQGQGPASGRRRLLRVAEWQGATTRALAPGSYLLRGEAAGRAVVRFPFLAERGGMERVVLMLPPAAAVPEGFIYVPPGWSLFGSDDDDDLRRGYFKTTPQHRVWTDGYLIGRTEVTMGEYIEFLRSLTRKKRAQRMPVGIDSNLRVKLEELPRRGAGRDWRFTLVTPQEDVAREQRAWFGEPIHYLGRAQRSVQDWRRFPVAGISLEDAKAYLGWLDRSGRLPGARLCSEYEWERAARGADGREFPHGDDLEPDDANFDETYGRRSYGPDEVGAHPASSSPFGVEDMTGNVWEWVQSVQDPRDAVHRGGTWWDNRITGRSVNREISQALVRNPLIGLRVCASLPGEAQNRKKGGAR